MINMNKLSDIESKLETVDLRFRKDSKRHRAARYIVRQERLITTDERKALCGEIPIGDKTLRGLFVELKKMGLYPPASEPTVSELVPTPEVSYLLSGFRRIMPFFHRLL